MLSMYDIGHETMPVRSIFRAFFMNKPQNIQYKSSFWWVVILVFKLDIFLNTNCLNLDLLGLLYTLMLSLHLAPSNSFAEEISPLFIGWNIVNSDLGILRQIIHMTWVVLAPVVVSWLRSKLSAMNYQNLFSDSSSLLLTKSSNFTLDVAAHIWNLSSSEYETENPTKCNTSTRSCDRDTLWRNSPIAIRSGDKYPSFLKNCINACATAIFRNSFFFPAVSVRDLE